MQRLSFSRYSPGLIADCLRSHSVFPRRCGSAHLIHTGKKQVKRGRPAAAQHAQQQQLQDTSNPDLDEVELTQDDYEEQGLDTEVSQSEPDDLDPEGRPASLEDFYEPRDGAPQALIDELYSDVVYGPPVRGPSFHNGGA